MRQLLFISLVITGVACNNAAQLDEKSAKSDKTTAKSISSENIRNDISVKANGLNVQQAFLMFEDGRLVPQDNKVEVGQKVNLRLIIEGWEAKEGKVMLGASEKISTNEGTVILDEQDLFGSYPEGVNVADAGVITLSAIITRVDKLFKYFEVAYRVWDKRTDESVSGSYKLYLK